MVKQNRNAMRRVRRKLNRINIAPVGVRKTKTAITRLPVRSLDMVERTLRQRPPPSNVIGASPLYNYMRCRLDPFLTTGQGTGGIPDSAMVSRIVVDHRDFATITVGASGTFQMRLMPMLPVPLVMRPSAVAGFSINGVSIAASTAPLPASGSFNWFPAVEITEWANWITSASAGITLPTPTPYAAMKARIVSMAVRCFYTGAASTAAGTITVTADRSNTLPTSQEGLQSITISNSTVAGSTAINCYAQRINFGTATPVLDANAVTERSEVQLHVVPRRLDALKPWLDLPQLPVVLVDSSNNALLTVDVYGQYMGTALYDDGFEQAVLSFNSIPVGATFRFETAVCVEYQPAYTSSVAKLAKKPPTTYDDAIISKTESKLSQLPIATPISQVMKPLADPSDPDVVKIVDSVQNRRPNRR